MNYEKLVQKSSVEFCFMLMNVTFKQKLMHFMDAFRLCFVNRLRDCKTFSNDGCFYVGRHTIHFFVAKNSFLVITEKQLWCGEHLQVIRSGSKFRKELSEMNVN